MRLLYNKESRIWQRGPDTSKGRPQGSREEKTGPILAPVKALTLQPFEQRQEKGVELMGHTSAYKIARPSERELENRLLCYGCNRDICFHDVESCAWANVAKLNCWRGAWR